MRRSPRRPLILKRRKLPFQQNDARAAHGSQSHQAASPDLGESSQSSARQCFPDGIHILNHPSMFDTQVVVIPKNADLQSLIGALTARGKECGALGPNKFILLSHSTGPDNGSLCHPPAEEGDISALGTDGQSVKVEPDVNFPDVKPFSGIEPFNKELECGPLDDSLTNMQWLGRMNTCPTGTDPPKETINKENRGPDVNTAQGGPAPAAHTKDFFQDFENNNSHIQSRDAPADAASNSLSERPPYSYMAMIQFAINSSKNRKMTLKEIYTWIEDHFPYFRDVAKPGWKNSIRHNLSLHDMFIRETSADGKVSFWTIRPEANRCLTLDQVYKPGCDPMTTPVPVPMFIFSNQQHKKLPPDARWTPAGNGESSEVEVLVNGERRIKPLLPRTDSVLVPIQLPANFSVYLPSSAPNPPSASQRKRAISREATKVRIAPKVTKCDVPVVVAYPEKSDDQRVSIKEEPPVKCESPKSIPGRRVSSSRRKQHLTCFVHEEPILLCPDNTFFDSGLASDASTFHDKTLPEADERRHEQHSPEREFSFKTPIKGGSQLTSSTPSKPPPSVAAEPWKVTPVGKGQRNILDFSPIRTPGSPAVTPRHDYTTFSFSGTPFKDWALFNSPRELLNPATPRRAPEQTVSPAGGWGATPTNRSLTEGLFLDTMNASLSKILVDISFSDLDDDDLGMTNISWSEFMPTLK